MDFVDLALVLLFFGILVIFTGIVKNLKYILLDILPPNTHAHIHFLLHLPNMVETQS